MNLLLRTDGNPKLGNGHIVRMLAFAEALMNRGIRFSFALKSDLFWVSEIRKKGYGIHLLDKQDDHAFSSLIKQNGYTHLIYDTRNDLTVDSVSKIKSETRAKFVVIDSPENIRLAADIVLYPPILQLNTWNWDGFQGKIFSGWEYVMLRQQFLRRTVNTWKRNTVLLSFGSTDPFGLSETLLQKIREFNSLFAELHFLLVVGPQFERIGALQEQVARTLNVTIVRAPENIVELFQRVEFAIIAMGVTAYELAALSTPFLYISISDDHAKSGEVFHKHQLGFPLATLTDGGFQDFERKVVNFLENRISIREQLEDFSSRHQISNWDKIIGAIQQ